MLLYVSFVKYINIMKSQNNINKCIKMYDRDEHRNEF